MPIKNIAEFDAETAVAGLQYVDPNLVAVTDEVKKILIACLPPTIAEMNSSFGLNIGVLDTDKIKKAPFKLDDTYINSILIGANIDTESLAPRHFVNFSNLTIYWVGQRLQSQAQIDEATQKGAAVRAVMNQFLTGYADELGRRVWSELLPLPYAMLPEKWNAYSGIAVPFRARHDPGHNLWKVA